MIVRTLRCGRCGAPVHVEPEADLAQCEYCGGYSNPDGTVWAPQSASSDRKLRRLGEKAGRALSAGDRDRWRAAAQAYFRRETELAAADGARYHRLAPKDPAKLDEYAAKIVSMYELVYFDPEVSQAASECSNTIAELFAVEIPGGINPMLPAEVPAVLEAERAPAIQATGRLLKDYRRYFAALLHHPDYPYPVPAGAAEQTALDTTRAAIRQYESVWGSEAVEAVMTAVFGDRRLSGAELPCPGCGEPLDVAGHSEVRCPSCGLVTYVGH